MQNCPPALAKMAKATEVLFDGVNLIISKRVAPLLRSILNLLKRGLKMVSLEGLDKLKDAFTEMKDSNPEDLPSLFLYLQANVRTMAKGREYVDALYAMTTTLKRLFAYKLISDESMTGSWLSMATASQSATATRLKISSTAIVEFHKFNASGNGCLSADEIRSLMVANGFSLADVNEDSYFNQVFKSFASTATRGDAITTGVAIEDFPAFRKNLDVELVLADAGKTRASDGMTLVEGTRALKKLRHDVPPAKMDILRSNYFGRGDTITVRTFRKVEGSIDTWDVDADGGKRWVPGSLISKMVDSMIDTAEDFDGVPKKTVPRQLTKMFGVRIMDYTYAAEVMDDAEEDGHMKLDFSPMYAEIYDRNLVLKKAPDLAAVETYSLMGCKVSNPGSMVHKQQLAMAGQNHVFCLEVFGFERQTLGEEAGVIDAAHEHAKVKISLKKYLISAPTHASMKMWKNCIMANASLKTDNNKSAAESLLKAAAIGVKFGVGLTKVSFHFKPTRRQPRQTWRWPSFPRPDPMCR